MVSRRQYGGLWATMYLGALLFVLMATLLTLLTVVTVPVMAHPNHHMTKRDFLDIRCKGVYDISIYAKVNRICEDCYNLYRDNQLNDLCRGDCFTDFMYHGCLQALMIEDEKVEMIKIYIKQLRGAEPGPWQDCFTSTFYLACAEALQKEEELPYLQIWIKQLHGAEPGP